LDALINLEITQFLLIFKILQFFTYHRRYKSFYLFFTSLKSL